jgi:hypothetical protein
MALTTGQHGAGRSCSRLLKLAGSAQNAAGADRLALPGFSGDDRGVRTMLAGAVSDRLAGLEPAVLTAEIARLTGRARRGTWPWRTQS